MEHLQREEPFSSDPYFSTNFIPMALKFVLVEIVLVETVLVGDPLYQWFCYSVCFIFKSYRYIFYFQLERKEHLCREVIALCEKLDPAMVR